MFRLWKRYLLLAGAAGGLAYGSQHYQLDGWQHLRLQPVTLTPADEPPVGWDLGTNRVPNSSHAMSPSEVVGNAKQLIPVWNNSSLRTISASKPSSSTKNGADPRIRIASFNLHAFNETKLRKASSSIEST
jgi:hypothetical protein